MTRETKIGLLVGLAFIIVIGILLSDHMSSLNEPPTASLPIAGNSVRAGLGEMGGDDFGQMQGNPVVIVPRQNVPTHEEVTRRLDGPGVTLINPGNANLNPLETAPQPAPRSVPQPRQVNPPDETPAERLRREALARGEAVEPVDGDTVSSQPKTSKPVPPQPPAKQVARTYKAQSGDTLGTIALKALGANKKANREAIVAANPSLQSNRNLIVAGRTYVIPDVADGTAGKVAKPSSGTPSQVTPVSAEAAGEADAPVATTAGSMYVVQPGDTLWSIAVTELGSASQVSAIEQLNQDVLGDSEQLRPNMKLRLPAKKTAAAD